MSHEVQRAVQALPSLGTNSVVVTRSVDQSPQAELAWTSTFVPEAGASGDLPLLTLAQDSSYVGGTGAGECSAQNQDLNGNRR